MKNFQLQVLINSERRTTRLFKSETTVADYSFASHPNLIGEDFIEAVLEAITVAKRTQRIEIITVSFLQSEENDYRYELLATFKLLGTSDDTARVGTWDGHRYTFDEGNRVKLKPTLTTMLSEYIRKANEKIFDQLKCANSNK